MIYSSFRRSSLPKRNIMRVSQIKSKSANPRSNSWSQRRKKEAETGRARNKRLKGFCNASLDEGAKDPLIINY